LSSKHVKIAASILAADFTRLGEEIKRVEQGGADIIHVDVMDGRFVPNITVGPAIVKAIKEATHLPVDVHLMVEDPLWFIHELQGTGISMMSIHLEAAGRLDRTLERIRGTGARAGVAFNPSTPLDAIKCPMSQMDYILVMTVSPGFGGQVFLQSVLPKIEEARRRIQSAGLELEIEVDGGISPLTAPLAVRAGADILVAGTAIYGTRDVTTAISKLRGSTTRGSA